jgi:uncharacterized protein (TIGR03067 family)
MHTFLLTLTVAIAVVDPPEAMVAKALNGRWEADHQLSPDVPPARVRFENGKVIEFTPSTLQLSVGVDTSQNPWHIDITILDGQSKGARIPGIFKRDGNTLTLAYCIAGRPTNFSKIDNPSATVVLFKKVGR